MAGVDSVEDRGGLDMAPDDRGPSTRDAIAGDGAVAGDAAAEGDLALDDALADGGAGDADPTARPDMAPDPLPPGAPDGSAQVAALGEGDATVFVYADGQGGLRGLAVDGQARISSHWRVVQTDAEITRVTALRVGPRRWVAYGTAEGDVGVLQLGRPAQTHRILPALYGPPLLAAAEDGAWVVGRAQDGRLAWQRLVDGADGIDPGPLIVDDFDRGPPADALTIGDDVVLFFPEAGQCLALDAADGATTGSVVCPDAPGRLLAEGDRVAVAHFHKEAPLQQISVSPLYGIDDPFPLGRFVDRAGIGFPRDGAAWPITLRPRDRQRITASVVTAGGVWDSVRDWPLDAQPFAAVVAAARRDLPALAREGTCDDGRTCRTVADCGGACAGAVGSDHLVQLAFDDAGVPRIETLELRPRSVGDPPFGIAPLGDCRPTPEVCDGLDQDCDGRADDGRCCPVEPTAEFRWQTDLPIAMVDGVPEVLISHLDYSHQRVLYRLEGTQRWEGKTVALRRPDGGPGPLGVRFDGAVDGRFLLARDGVTALVARHAADGEWSLFMAHPTRLEAVAPPARVALGCDAVLAATSVHLGHEPYRDGLVRVGGYLIVCADRLVLVSDWPERPMRTFTLAELGLDRARWATLAHRNDSHVRLLIGDVADGRGRLSAWQLAVEDPDLISPGFLPRQVDSIAPEDTAWPIHLHPTLARPPVQVRDGGLASRMPFDDVHPDGVTRVAWREVLFDPAVRELAFSQLTSRLYGAGPLTLEDGRVVTAWWMTEPLGNSDYYDLWSTAPVLTAEGPLVWHAMDFVGDREWDLPYWDFGLAVVDMTDETGRAWRLRTFDDRCRTGAPAP